MSKMAKKMSTNLTQAFAEFMKSSRSRIVLVGVGSVLLLFVGGGLYFLKNQGIEKEQPSVPKAVELKIGQEKAKDDGEKVQQASFFLHPLPDELLQQLASMENLNENVTDAKFTGLRVLWPVYYFANQDAGGGKATLLLDVSEDGFGVLIESEVELAAYPALNTLQAGQKIWIGGEILAVDPSGTGTIYLKTEHLQFNDEQPFQAGQPQAN